MSFDRATGLSFCERCGYQWMTKPFEKKFIEPRSCAKCKSKVWNQPRTYGGKWLDGNAPMARRFKPTGRAAARLAPDRIRKEKLQDAKIRLRIARNQYDKDFAILSDPMNFVGLHPPYDRKEIAYYVHQYSEIIKDIKAEIEALENTQTNPPERIAPEFNMGICAKCHHPRDFNNFCCEQTKKLKATHADRQ